MRFVVGIPYGSADGVIHRDIESLAPGTFKEEIAHARVVQIERPSVRGHRWHANHYNRRKEPIYPVAHRANHDHYLFYDLWATTHYLNPSHHGLILIPCLDMRSVSYITVMNI